MNGFIHQSFKKVRIEEKGDPELENLFNKRRFLRTKYDEASKDELEKLKDDLAEKYSESNYKKIKDEVRAMSGEEGGYNPGHLWKLKKKLVPLQSDPPTAMND